jgi:hypothetical protein
MYSYDRSASARTAALSDGPIGRILEKWWDEVHDLEYQLKMADRDYHDAAHFSGRPAEHDAKNLIKMLEGAVRDLEHVTTHVFADLVNTEAAFIKKHGAPDEYSDKMRAEIFPRAAAVQTKADFSKLQHQMAADLDTFEIAWGMYNRDPEKNKHKLDDAVKYMKDLHALAAVLIKNMEQLKAG